MRSRIAFWGVLCIFFFTSSNQDDADAHKTKTPIYLNTSYSFEERSADLVSRFTLEEKQSLLGHNMPAIPRLGVRQYNLWSEALHGLIAVPNPSLGLDAPTSFSNNVALGSSWDPALVQRAAEAIADEARAFFATGTKGLTIWSPTVEPVRDPRWGRTAESFGEDPFLVSQISGGFIRGLVGDDPTYLKSVPTAKHYLANNSEFDRHVGSSNMDSRDMREFYIAPYKKLIEEDNIPAIMCAFNAVNGVPITSSRYFLDTIAKRTYGLNGYLIGDCGSVNNIVRSHRYKETHEEAVALALMAGLDMDCGNVFQRFTLSALNKGLVSINEIDRALLNMFTVRMRTGEFDPPGKVPYAQSLSGLVNSPANKSLAHEVATKTPVLLKNETVLNTNKKALPVNPSEIKKIALIGPQIDKVELGTNHTPAQDNTITPLAGIKNYIERNGHTTEVVFSPEGNTSRKSHLLFVAYFELIKAKGSVTRYDATKYSSASPGITVGSGLGTEMQVRSIHDGSWTAYENVNLVDVDSIGIGLNIPIEGGIVEVRVGSPEGDLLTTLNATTAAGMRSGGLYGTSSLTKIKVNKSGFTGTQTLYLVYKAPEDKKISGETIEMAKSADVAIVFVGTDDKMSTEEVDRPSLSLPGNQVELIKAVAAVNKNTIVVMQTLGCMEIEEFKNLQNIPGIIWVGFNGQAQGDAMAEILFGDVNPGGKLNATWYKSESDLPAFTDYTLRGGSDKNGRTLWYFNKDVSYEFGFGLSYTTFEYSNFKISKNTITPNDKIMITVDVKNTGSRDGDEVVQIYMKTPDSPASLQRPIKRLKGFQRVTIPAGQTKTVDVEINCADLWFWDMAADKMTYDQGRYVFEIGSSSKDIRGSVNATMSGTPDVIIKTVVASCGVTLMKLGASAHTEATAAMSDDSFYDISKAKIVYSSNNPAVAAVDANGLVTAKSSGVATITVHVTVGNVTKSGSFPVKVMPNLNAASITVNNKTITGFNQDITQYSYLMKEPSQAVPAINATSVDASVEVEVIQVKAIPGTASVSVTDYNTYDKKEYYLNFGLSAVSNDFNGADIIAPFKWVREKPANRSIAGGLLSITSGAGDIAGAGNNAENILLQSANSDWTVETKIICSRKPSGSSQNAGLLAYQDDDNFVRLVYRANLGRRGAAVQTAEQPGSVELMVESRGDQKSSVMISMAGIIKDNNTLVLRLVKKGDQYTAYYSTDGKKFQAVGSTNILLKDIQAGIIVCDGVAPVMTGGNAPQQVQTPFKVSFDYFKITSSGLK